MNSDDLPAIDLYGLRLLRAVAARGSITAAAADSGLTQSALTRQIHSMEAALGIRLFDRTTRRLEQTPACTALLAESADVIPRMNAAIRRAALAAGSAPRILKLGMSHSLATAHLPGLLHGHMRQDAGADVEIRYLSGVQLLAQIVSGELDAAVLCPPKRLPPEVRVCHRMTDGFHLIAACSAEVPGGGSRRPRQWTRTLVAWLSSQRWLMPSRDSATGKQLALWMKERGIVPSRVSLAGNFDLIVQLVASGLGVALVPHRALAAFRRRGLVRRIPVPDEFKRELVVLVRRTRVLPDHVRGWIDGILFS